MQLELYSDLINRLLKKSKKGRIPRKEATSQIAEILGRIATLKVVKGDYLGALKDSRKCVSLDPMFTPGYFQMGRSHFALVCFYTLRQRIMLDVLILVDYNWLTIAHYAGAVLQCS